MLAGSDFITRRCVVTKCFMLSPPSSESCEWGATGCRRPTRRACCTVFAQTTPQKKRRTISQAIIGTCFRRTRCEASNYSIYFFRARQQRARASRVPVVMRKRTPPPTEAPSAVVEAPSTGEAQALHQPAPAPSARKVQKCTEPPPDYVVQRRESIHVGACTSTKEEASSSANYEERTVSLTASESMQVRQFHELRFCSGCRLWDSGLALSRWLCTKGEPDILDKEVLELGSGVGLVGLVAARKARRVRLTDGEPRLLPNLRHNAAQAAQAAAPMAAQVARFG